MTTNLNGITLQFHDVGRGPALLLLHAFPLSGEMWRPQLDALGADYRVIVPDLRGFGGTDAPSPDGSMRDLAADCLELLNHLGVERFVLGGLSMGGYVAFEILRQVALDRVTGLLLCDTKPGADTDDARANRLAMAEKALDEGPLPIAEMMIPKLLGETSRAERPEVVRAVRGLIEANSGAGIAAGQRAMAARPDSTPLLPTLRMPALVIVGEEDELASPSDTQAWATKLAHGALHIVPRAGHLPNMEQPETFNATLWPWLNRLNES